jgi:hypothetical protein
MATYGTNNASISDILSGLGTNVNSNASIGDILGSLGGNTTTNTPSFTDSLFTPDNLNALGSGVGALSDLFNIYAGIRGLNQSKDQFNFNRDLALTNLNNQANLTNEQLATRQATRLRSQGITGDANAQAVADFMAKYGVSGNLGG